MTNLSNLKTFVISLDDYIENLKKQLPYLEEIGLKVEKFRGINALKDEHLQKEYEPYLSTFAKNFTPKSVIGCALSHILCCKHILENYVKNNDGLNNNSSFKDKTLYLIMEDDAFPKYNKEDFYKELNKSICEITLLDPDWEIIQLHSDGPFPTEKTFSTHYLSGSTAAYLISEKGLNKMLKQKAYGHLDFEIQNFITFNKYRVKNNLFYTDEKTSTNRIIQNKSNFNNMTMFLKVKFLEIINKYFIELRGEKTCDIYLKFKMLKLPYLKREYTANELIDYLVGFFIIKKLYL